MDQHNQKPKKSPKPARETKKMSAQRGTDRDRAEPEQRIKPTHAYLGGYE
jgi:hypothetical protein